MQFGVAKEDNDLDCKFSRTSLLNNAIKLCKSETKVQTCQDTANLDAITETVRHVNISKNKGKGRASSNKMKEYKALKSSSKSLEDVSSKRIVVPDPLDGSYDNPSKNKVVVKGRHEARGEDCQSSSKAEVEGDKKR
ncbi:hypothetical protein Ancab_030534 [Ancistrocladus abbreviatus]